MTKLAIKRKSVELPTPRLQADANGNYPKEIEIVRAGEWHTPWHGDFIINVGDIDLAIEQFNAGVYRVEGTEPLPITLDHLGGESPAAGRVDRVYRVEDSLYASVTWGALGKEKLDRDEYRYISFEFWPRSMPLENPEVAGDMWVNVLTGATLTNDPLFKKLKPVMASAKGGNSDNKPNLPEGGDMDIKDLRVKKKEDLTDAELAYLKEHKAELTDEERTTFGLADAPAPTPAPAPEPQPSPEPAPTPAPAPGDGGVNASVLKTLTPEQRALFEGLQADAKKGADAQDQLTRMKLEASVKPHVDRGVIKSDDFKSTVDQLMASSEESRTNYLKLLEGVQGSPLLGGVKGNGGEGLSASVEVTPEELAMGEAFGITREQLEAHKKEQPTKEGN